MPAVIPKYQIWGRKERKEDIFHSLRSSPQHTQLCMCVLTSFVLFNTKIVVINLLRALCFWSAWKKSINQNDEKKPKQILFPVLLRKIHKILVPKSRPLSAIWRYQVGTRGKIPANQNQKEFFFFKLSIVKGAKKEDYYSDRAFVAFHHHITIRYWSHT